MSEATASIDFRCCYEAVAVQFFRGLRESLEHSPYGDDVAASAVRVCVPRIDVADMGGRVGRILDAAGWRPAHGRITVYEPESNACGMFARGRNATWYPRRRPSPLGRGARCT
jgi:hypothetical protein